MTLDDTVGQRTAQILDEAKRILVAGWWVVLAYFLLMTALGTAVDVNASAEDIGGDFGLSVVGVVTGYLLIIKLIDMAKLAPLGRQAGFGTYFGMSIVIGLATMLGVLLLILPGLYLSIRWSAAYGFALISNEKTSDALGNSWRATEEHVWPIALALLLPTLGFAAGLAVYFTDEALILPLTVALPANVLIYGSTVASTAIGLAVFTCIVNRNAGISDVFE
ncbi:hypothetical protein HKD42_03560 [Altererythrobacter sp. RZ02]|uniref:Glycerophosphoryl diester phosphodiesterase membrane domain-containing protein n=1 Tax=Pontixanthobacter rizhaonensis TaxID=2730337 RepID=A0A848QF19_9SPHN|nr:hypothetical protein [Pontixanthobacter rizhaonensis]NMW31132.1 hypothetical protein [Pontixanthobacter rizhaonensis]